MAWHERHQGYLKEKRRLAKEWRQGRRQLEHEEAVSKTNKCFSRPPETIVVLLSILLFVFVFVQYFFFLRGGGDRG